MIPFRDDNPSRGIPFVTITLIAINALVFFYQLSLSERGQLEFMYAAALIPREATTNLIATIPDFFTAMFMHGGWLHIVGNMLYLWIFGDNIEEKLGHFLYVPFYLACGIAASVAQIAINPTSQIPTLGASGAIAGVLGAYLVLFPNARVQTLILFGGFGRVAQVPAVWLLGFWFVMQLLPGFASIGVEGGGVAYFAHIGGFIAGAAAIWVYAQATGIPTLGQRGRQDSETTYRDPWQQP